jgi:hypothetical protein
LQYDTRGTLDVVVARIKVSGRGEVLPVPPADAVRRFIARVERETPMSREEEAAWNHAWARVIDEMHRRDHEDDIAEGRG